MVSVCLLTYCFIIYFRYLICQDDHYPEVPLDRTVVNEKLKKEIFSATNAASASPVHLPSDKDVNPPQQPQEKFKQKQEQQQQ